MRGFADDDCDAPMLEPLPTAGSLTGLKAQACGKHFTVAARRTAPIDLSTAKNRRDEARLDSRGLGKRGISVFRQRRSGTWLGGTAPSEQQRDAAGKR